EPLNRAAAISSQGRSRSATSRQLCWASSNLRSSINIAVTSARRGGSLRNFLAKDYLQFFQVAGGQRKRGAFARCGGNRKRSFLHCSTFDAPGTAGKQVVRSGLSDGRPIPAG